MANEDKQAEVDFFVEINPNPVVVTDESLAILYLNPASRLYFFDLEELGLRHPVLQGLASFREQLKKRSEGLFSFVREVEMEGKTFEEQIFALPEKNMIYLYLVDITERKRAELELKNREAQLQTANLRLGELLTLKDQLLNNVTHELRTPLTAIREGMNLLKEEILGSLSEPQLQLLGIVVRNCQRLSGLVDKVLDYSRVRAGRMRTFRGRLSLRMVIEKNLGELKNLAGQRTLKAEFPPLPDVFADPEKIFQVLVNLLSNAVKFTKENGTIACACCEQEEFVAVTVQDDGVGISPMDLSKLFEQFSQVGEYKAGGTGLGLALCKEIINLHKGKISVTSEPGKGSAFTFTLPVYSPRLALEEYFEEVRETSLRYQASPTVGFIAMDGEPLLPWLASARERPGGPGPAQNRLELLEQLAELLRPRLKNGDAVIPLEPQWVVILASSADAKGIQAICERVQGFLKGCAAFQSAVPIQVPLGMALFPVDGKDAHALFAKARESLALARVQSENLT